MSELLALQAGFARALRDTDATPAAGRWIAGDAALRDRRLAIYRANMVAAADKALSAACPVVRQVVGEEFFHALAREYQREHPSTSGDLGDFGAEFPHFLDTFEHTRSLPYLPDLARLEWAAHRAYGAADGVAWDPAALAAVEVERQEQIRLHWSPGLAVVDSPYPIVRIWTIHQPGHGGEFAVDWDVAERALVARDGFAVTVAAIGVGDAAFLRASFGGAPLGDAAAAALQADPLFDLAALLGRAITSRLVCGFTL
ncbi:MAG: DNA-binding domain-containing protein [Betaproteobacteria bacterium]